MRIKADEIVNPFFTGPRHFVLYVKSVTPLEDLGNFLKRALEHKIDGIRVKGPKQEGRRRIFLFYLGHKEFFELVEPKDIGNKAFLVRERHTKDPAFDRLNSVLNDL